MPKVKISEYSATANSNTDVASINIDEGCAPSGINNAIRAVMGHLKDFQQGTNGDPFNGPVNGTLGATTANTAVVTTLNSTDATDASSTTAAAMKTAGGLGVAKKMFVGLDANIYGLTVGRGAGAVSTNTAVGASALAANTTGSTNSAVGYQAGYSNTTAVGITAVGAEALYSNTTGYNTAVGYRALYANTTGSDNVAFGGSGASPAALRFNSTGSYNTALGTGALQANTTASNNTAVGYQAGYTNVTGIANTFIGYQAGYTSNTIAANGYNTATGYQAGKALTTGNNNSFFGFGSGQLITSGGKNTIVGAYDGNTGGLDIRTASNYIVLSDGDGTPRARWATSGTFTSTNTNGRNFQWDGAEVYIDVDNTVTLGFPSFRWTVVYATTGTINTSDANAKQDIAALNDAEKRVAIAIKSLIKKYRFKDAVAKKGDAARIHVGVVAQEVQAAFVAEGLDPARYALFCSDTWYEVDGKPASEANTQFTQNTPNAIEVTRLGIRYDELLAFVIAAI
jgi:hypothetical protein